MNSRLARYRVGEVFVSYCPLPPAFPIKQLTRKERAMRKIIIATIAAAALTLGIAAPVQANASDRRMVKVAVMAVFYDSTYDEQDTLCWGWNNYPSMAISTLSGAFKNTRISRSDVRSGIRQAFNTVC
jgi:hypothetical protein